MNPWSNVMLRDVAEIERNVVEASAIVQGTRYVGLENVQSGGALIDVRPVGTGELASSKFAFSPQHVLYGKLRPYLAKIARPEFGGVCSTDILPVLPGPSLDRNYLAHFLLTPAMVALASSRMTGANLPRLSPQALAEFPVPLPSVHEQRRIAEILDKADALRIKRRAAIAHLDSLTQAIFLDMFGDPVSNSNQWQEGTVLGDIAEIVSGVTIGRRLNGQTTRPVPYLAVSNVHDRSLDLDKVKSVLATEDEIGRYRLIENDLVLTEGGDPDKLGRGALWRSELPECIHQNHIFRVRINNDSITPLFLSWLVGSPRGKRYFFKSAKQTTGIASINMTQLRGLPLLLPPKRLQLEFAKRAIAVDRHRAIQVVAMSECNALFASLQHRAFRGEL